MPDTLLPPESTSPFELAQSLTSAARRPLPAYLIKALWNPQTCPLELLPYLAWTLGLEVWDDGWSELKKRTVVADVWRLKRNKTRLKGIRGYLQLFGCDVIKAVRPKDKSWFVRTQTKEQRDATMASMPKIRIFPQALPVPAPYAKSFYSGPDFRSFERPLKFLYKSDAALLWSERVVYVDGDIQVKCYVRGIQDALDGSYTVSIFTGGSVAKSFSSGRDFRSFWQPGKVDIPSDAGEHVLAITPSLGAPSFAVPSGAIPTTVHPVPSRPESPGKPGQTFWGVSFYSTGALYRSDAYLHVYDELTLFDTKRMGPTKQPFSFWGWSPNGQPPYEAKLTIDIPLKRSPYAFDKTWGVGVWRKNDMSLLWNALGLVRLSQAARDLIWVSTTTYVPIVFETGLRFGTFELGGYRRVA